MNEPVLILGGAGFIGSRIARALVAEGHPVSVVDGLLPRTGARRENLAGLPGVVWRECRIEDCADLPELIAGHRLVIDAMAWTCHRLALHDPKYDLSLNLLSHLHFMEQVPAQWPGRVIFLASRGQYGSPAGVAEIREDTPQTPEDVQGIHKTAAEAHFRLWSRLRKVPVASLRMAAVVGPNQPTTGDDIGLFGGFIRDLVEDKEVELYGETRKRSVLAVDDVAEIVGRMARAPWTGFTAYNLAGALVNLAEVLRFLVKEIGRGRFAIRPVPEEVAAIDIGGLPVSEAKLAELIGPLPRKSVEDTLRAAIETFRV